MTLGLTSIATMPSANSAGTSRARRSIITRKSSSRTAALPPLAFQALRQVRHETIGRDPVLLQRVAIPHGHRSVRGGLAVYGDAKRRARFVLPAVAAADRATVVVEHVVVLAEVVVDAARQLGHPVLVDEGKHGRFERRDGRMHP